MADEQNSVIITRELRKVFDGTAAVDNVTLDVPRGSIFGFIGPSGSGKTTTIRLLTGIYKPTSGYISVLGKPPQKFTPATRARIGYMPQHFVLYPHLSVWENLNFAASLYGMGLFRGRRLHKALNLVELDPDRGKLARELSGGMQRRLSLAATLVHDPQLFFLDEPTSGVDPVLRLKLWEHFRELQQAGRTLFVTTQYVSEAEYCDWIGVMANGKLLTVDTPVGLRHQAYGGDVVEMTTTQPLDELAVSNLRQLPFVRQVTRSTAFSVRIVVDEARTAIPALLDWCRTQNLPVQGVEEFVPPFDDVFVQLVQSREEKQNV